jgi:hypothetical protein
VCSARNLATRFAAFAISYKKLARPAVRLIPYA